MAENVIRSVAPNLVFRKWNERQGYEFCDQPPPTFIPLMSANSKRISWIVQNSYQSTTTVLLWWLPTNADPLDPSLYVPFRELAAGECTGENVSVGSIRCDGIYVSIHPIIPPDPGTYAFVGYGERYIEEVF